MLYEEIEEQIKKDTDLKLDITNVNWFSTYKVHTRHVDKFSVGRVFLGGRLRAHSLARRSARDEYRHSGRLQPRVETRVGATRQRRAASCSTPTTRNACRMPSSSQKRPTDSFGLAAGPEPLACVHADPHFPVYRTIPCSASMRSRNSSFPRISQIQINYEDYTLKQQVRQFQG